jgi:hypothetical protein
LRRGLRGAITVLQEEHGSTRYPLLELGCLGIVGAFLPGGPTSASNDDSFVGPLNTVTTIASTVPKNRDV